jgi:hypothetical protein
MLVPKATTAREGTTQKQLPGFTREKGKGQKRREKDRRFFSGGGRAILTAKRRDGIQAYMPRCFAPLVIRIVTPAQV